MDGEAFLVQSQIALEALDTAVDNIAARKKEMKWSCQNLNQHLFWQRATSSGTSWLIAQYSHLLIELVFDDCIVDLVS